MGRCRGRDHRGREAEFLSRADGYVHPSRWESYGIALLENLALGVPCLASSTIHLAADLRRDDAAILATPDARGLADGLVALAAAPPDLGARGRALVERRFAWSTVIPEFLASLEALDGSGPAAGGPIGYGFVGIPAALRSESFWAVVR